MVLEYRVRIMQRSASQVSSHTCYICSFERVALKHYTSKLTNYDDLTTLQTFGFRGEALSSLCALSDFHVITAQVEDAPKGTKLDFEISGELKSTQIVASQKGTTVAVENLFRNLPVRRRELEKNIKREYGKVLSILQAYACISTEVKFSVSNMMAKGKKTIVFATKSNPKTRENIANVFGAKVLPALTIMDLRFEMQDSSKSSLQRSTTETDSENKQVRITGHISRPVFGEGRQTPDRQMFFVNARPCGLPQVAKIFNEVYKSFNVSQSPFIFANIVLDTNAYDVNVSPDKRTILLHDQGALLENLRTSLTNLFEKEDQTVPQTQRLLQKLPSFKQLTIQRDTSVPKSSDREDDEPDESDSGNDIESANSTSVLRETGSTEQESIPSLIEDFAARDTRERTRGLIRIAADPDGREPISKNKQKLVKKLSRNSNSAQSLGESENTRDTITSDDLEDSRSIPVLDFNKRIAEQQATTESHHVLSSRSSDEEAEEDVPSIVGTPKKPAPGVVQNAFERMRPQRTPPQTATITIGNKTTTSILGPTISKLPKVIPSPRTTEPSRSVALQRFSSSIRSFDAPDTRIEVMGSLRPSHSFAGSDEISGVTGAGSFTPSSEPDGSDSEISVQSIHQHDGGHRDSSVEENELDSGLEQSSSDEKSDEEYMDDSEKKTREDEKVAALIQHAEEAAAMPSQDNIARANKLLNGRGHKEATVQLIQLLDESVERIDQSLTSLETHLQNSLQDSRKSESRIEPEAESPEERLSLKVSREDFSHMHIVGQFNLGFILAVRTSHAQTISDELFIIDQHASDEKYNFERLQATTIVQNQRLVHPHPLDLTAVEEEVLLENSTALVHNGFLVDVDLSGDSPVGQRCKLQALPMSREITFDTSDLEELIVLLAESGSSVSAIPRPSRVRRMFAMRACRSSVMIGKSLSIKHMDRLVRQMGEIDKPWNCPHGRPTMRHVLGLSAWDSWHEGDGLVGLGANEAGEKNVDWREWMSTEGNIDDEENIATGSLEAEGKDNDNETDEEDEGDEEREEGETEDEEGETEDEEGEEEEEAERDDDDDSDEGDADEEAVGPSKLNLLGRFDSRG
ncbi:MAG: hypothetical protein Q9195_009202 [Heterodermia aff. obscurata]